MCNRLGLGFRVRVRVRDRLRVRVRLRLRVNKLDINYNIVTSPLYIGYSGPWLRRSHFLCEVNYEETRVRPIGQSSLSSSEDHMIVA